MLNMVVAMELAPGVGHSCGGLATLFTEHNTCARNFYTGYYNLGLLSSQLLNNN